MNISFSVLRGLSDRRFRSGTELAAELGVSRTTVHNAISQACDHGVQIHRVTGRGYRLARPIIWLDPESIKAGAASFSVRIADQLVSTNAELMRICRLDPIHKLVLAAEWQSDGRGRRGRQWLAVPGGSLLFSVLWRFGRPIGALSGLSLVVGLAVVNVLRRYGLAEVGLKWPNDLIWRNGKLGGLLIELEGDMQSPGNAVIGVGLNLRLPDSVKASIDQPVVSMEEIFVHWDRNALLAAILVEMEVQLMRFERDGFAAFRADWEAVHLHQDLAVRVMRGQGEVVEGVARGVDGNGALCLETTRGMELFHAGEVSLRPVT